jgi:hypothetical protein
MYSELHSERYGAAGYAGGKSKSQTKATAPRGERYAIYARLPQFTETCVLPGPPKWNQRAKIMFIGSVCYASLQAALAQFGDKRSVRDACHQQSARHLQRNPQA